MSNKIRLLPTNAPALPIAPLQYDKDYANQNNNVLRLYFSGIDNVTKGLLGYGGGIYLQYPHASLSNTTTQTIAVINTPYGVPFTSVNTAHQISVGTPSSRIIVEQNGVYNFQFSLQLAKTSGGAVNVWIWARINGVDQANSNSKISITGSSTSETIAAWNFVFPMNANDYFELMWASDSTSAIIEANSANSFSPAIPPAILTVTFVSALYS